MKPSFHLPCRVRQLGGLSYLLLLCLLAALAVATYLVVAQSQNREFGFPLDDAWIHQVYARNLGTRGEFEFLPGQPSAGSTSPLWVALLGAGYSISLDYRVWTIALGIGLLAAGGWMAGRITAQLTPDRRISRWTVPLLMLFEWHLVWAAVSGMEIGLFVLLSLALVDRFWRRAHPAVLGLLAGLLILTRPDGVILALLVGIGVGLAQDEESIGGGRNGFARLVSAPGIYGVTLLVVLLPYVLFNWQVSGALLPNTFYAKASEYAELTKGTSFPLRWLAMYRQPLIGAQLLLAPGLLYLLVRLARERRWSRLAPFGWLLVLPALYAARLPVEYQFGRYMMPLIPFIVVGGVVGTAELLARARVQVLRQAWRLSAGVLAAAFFVLGGFQYAKAVGVVNCEMVTTAHWNAEHLPPGALVAAHDIGAQGYFDVRPLLDLAGLVSPEVIPFMRDQQKLESWIESRGAEYVVFFPTWYPQLASSPALEEVHSTGCELTPSMGEENLVVYRVR